MKHRRVHYPLKYRRARTLVYAVALFWLWTWLGSAAFIASLFHSPIHALIAMYGLVTFVLISIPVLLLAIAQMALNRPVALAETATVIPLERRAPNAPRKLHFTRSAS